MPRFQRVKLLFQAIVFLSLQSYRLFLDRWGSLPLFGDGACKKLFIQRSGERISCFSHVHLETDALIRGVEFYLVEHAARWVSAETLMTVQKSKERISMFP